MSDERPKSKKSWREVDAQRDRGGGARAPGGAPKPGEAQKSRSYRAALESLFEKGGFARVAKALGRDLSPEDALSPDAATEPPPEEKVAPKAQAPAAPEAPRPNRILTPAAVPRVQVEDGRTALRKKVMEAIGRDEITRALDRYLARFPLPDDYEVLEQALEHSDEERVDAALGILEGMVAKEKPRRARTLIGKLRYLEENGDSRELKARAVALRGKLG